MNAKLEKIKAALRHAIELSEKATPGPWEAKKEIFADDTHERQYVFHAPDEDTEYPCAFALGGTKEEANAAFIAHARTFTPAAATALLTAIDGLEAVVKFYMRYTHPWKCSKARLETICNQWPEDVV